MIDDLSLNINVQAKRMSKQKLQNFQALANAAESKSGSKIPAEGEKDPSKRNKAGDPNAPSSDGPPGKASPAGDGPGGEAAGGPEGAPGGPDGAPGGPDGPGGPGGGPDVPGDGNDPPDPSGGKKEDKKHDANNPPSSAAKRVLILSQKGDWPACEQALKGLERAMAEGGEKLPLANVHDNVSESEVLLFLLDFRFTSNCIACSNLKKSNQ